MVNPRFMRIQATLYAFLFLTNFLYAQTRIWTSHDGKKIEAELVKVDGANVVLLMQGKEFRVPSDRLSPEDQAFLKQSPPTAPAATGSNVGELFGTKLVPGQKVDVTGPLNEKTIKALDGNKLKPTKMKIRLQIPADFDPNKPQKVFWAVAAINNEGEQRAGNIGATDRWKGAYAKGWLVIGADTEHGNPSEFGASEHKHDHEFHRQVIAEITQVWPNFKTWKHVCGGHSGGAKMAFFRIAQLLDAKVNVVGGFFSGCNACYASAAIKETGIRASDFRDVKGFQSTGDKDHLVNADHIKSVTQEMQANGFKKIESKTFPGGHSMSAEQLGEAVDWFLLEK